jgi:hypothetical protein
MSMNKTWAISSWISFLISADILSGDYFQYFTPWNSASFALDTAMTKVNGLAADSAAYACCTATTKL